MDQASARNRSILLMFAGGEIGQQKAILEIQDGYECWNLRKFSCGQFIDILRKRIPPVNNNVLRHYEAGAGNPDFGITEPEFKECSWGLLIPDSLDDAIANNYAESLFLLNLYSPAFLYPLFHASDFGIMSSLHNKKLFEFAHSQNQAHIFSTKNFVVFFKTLLPQSQYANWVLNRVQKWSKEDWRLFVAGMLYSGLTDYDTGKTSFGWQRESADMAALLESLFTAGDTQNEEIGYRLRKRMAVLLVHRFPSIEKDIKKLYTERSSFVHGSFFAQIAKESKVAHNNLPVPDFGILYKQKEYVRWAFVAYLYLAQLVKAQPKSYGSSPKVIGLLENAIINIELRSRMLDEIERVLGLMPPSEPFDDEV